MARNWEYAAGVLWPVLANAARKRKTLHYEDLAPLISTNDRNVGKGLGPILHYCLYCNLPPLTSIVINKGTRKPGQGFNAWDIDRIDEAHRQVFQFDWRNLENPFGQFSEDDTTDALASQLVTDPSSAGEISKKVTTRGVAQVVFRKALLSAYDGQCSMCELSFEAALEAAHIIPWSESTAPLRVWPRNGVLLCANHHRLFDKGWISVSRKFKISYVGEPVRQEQYSDADLAATVNLHGRYLRLPENKDLWPSRKLLQQRRDRQ